MELDDIYVRFWYNDQPTDYYINPYNKGVYSTKSNKLLKPSIDRNGYVNYTLYINGEIHRFGYHQLVALVFLDKPDDQRKNEVDHLDCVKSNNRYDNLEWVSRLENVRRSFEKGLHKPRDNENNVTCIYPNSVVIEALELLQEGCDADKVSEHCNLPMRFVYGLVSGRVRPSLSKKYNIPKTVLKRPIGKKASDEEIVAVRSLKQKGCSMKDVSEKTGIPFNKVKLIWYYKNIDIT